jgi:hypothetical protein
VPTTQPRTISGSVLCDAGVGICADAATGEPATRDDVLPATKTPRLRAGALPVAPMPPHPRVDSAQGLRFPGHDFSRPLYTASDDIVSGLKWNRRELPPHLDQFVKKADKKKVDPAWSCSPEEIWKLHLESEPVSCRSPTPKVRKL